MTKREEILLYIKDIYLSPDVDGEVEEILRDVISKLEQTSTGEYISKEEVFNALNNNHHNEFVNYDGLVVPEHYQKKLYHDIEKIQSVNLSKNCRLIDATYTLNMLEKYCDANCKYTECERDVMCRACPIGDAIEIVEDTPTIFEVKE